MIKFLSSSWIFFINEFVGILEKSNGILFKILFNTNIEKSLTKQNKYSYGRLMSSLVLKDEIMLGSSHNTLRKNATTDK